MEKHQAPVTEVRAGGTQDVTLLCHSCSPQQVTSLPWAGVGAGAAACAAHGQELKQDRCWEHRTNPEHRCIDILCTDLWTLSRINFVFPRAGSAGHKQFELTKCKPAEMVNPGHC